MNGTFVQVTVIFYSFIPQLILIANTCIFSTKFLHCALVSGVETIAGCLIGLQSHCPVKLTISFPAKPGSPRRLCTTW